MSTPAAFSEKLDLVLKALSMSRGRLAAELGVDKSLVGRWASGAVTPSAHNLENLTRLVAAKRDGFTMLDWDRDLPGLADVFGVQVRLNGHVPAQTRGAADGLPLPVLDMARLTTERRGAAYEGFWRTTRPSVMMPGRFFHDHGVVRRAENGLLQFKMGGAGLLFDGWLLPAEGQLFAILFDTVGQTPIFLIFNGVPLSKASFLDGLVMAAALNAARTPSAYPIVMERIGDLTGDEAADEATCAELLSRDPLIPEDEVDEAMRRHLVRDIGPAAAAAGGDLFLLAPITSTLSRGETIGGRLQG
ncbi:MAG: helix-turn-helix domain-containing protein [Phenylobacterium sp.]|jgi:transcriptional regulator with XRE-family HTH domain|uniref:helix-turn-helix domain-containing protein n=1 Tax=Phenylobacterium sp. TaxID=1871053 RepID=UPI00391AA1AA